MMAADSFARSILMPVVYALDIALVMGGFDPEDVPGVEEGVDGAVMAGWPSPGVRFVEQPNAAMDVIAAAAAKARKPRGKCCVFLCIEASSFSLDYGLFRATGEPVSEMQEACRFTCRTRAAALTAPPNIRTCRALPRPAVWSWRRDRSVRSASHTDRAWETGAPEFA